jgi:hypothetical protein
MPMSVQNSGGKAKGALPLRAKHQSEAALRGKGLCGCDKWRSNPSRLKPCEGRKWISKALVGLAQDSLGGKVPGTGSTGGHAPVKQASWERIQVEKPQGLNKKSWFEGRRGFPGGATWDVVPQSDLA